jgi:acyl-CoA reductase-like NAD-dependent aldehyde dehydrogenase
MTAIAEFGRLSNRLLIGGEQRASKASTQFEVTDPATEDVVGKVADSTEAEVEEAIRIANKAQRAWNKTNALTRAELLHEVSHHLREQRPLIAEMLTREMGKTYKESFDEVSWAMSAID